MRLLRFLILTGRRELQIALRQPQEIINSLVFFVIAVTLFPLAVGSEPKLLRDLAPGIIWVAALFATLLSLNRLFRFDFEDGTLEQMLLSPYSLSLLVLAKVFAHWLLTGLPLVLLAPVLASMLGLPLDCYPALVGSLLLGTPILTLIGSFGSALTVSLRGGGEILLTLIILPLSIPVLVFGTTCIIAATSGLALGGYLALLGALLILAITLIPCASSAALKMTLY